MNTFRVLPIPAALAQEVRATGRSPQYGHPTHTEIATGRGPCRSCLRTFRVGEESRILVTFNPFEGLDSYPSPGPIFLHAEACVPFSGTSRFPEELRSLRLTLEGYGADRWVLARERPSADDVETSIRRLFENPAVRYIHVRSTEAGCYIASVERPHA
jgi:hypothetical protein